jgi:hypothetical protein
MFIHPSTRPCVSLPTCFPVCLYIHSCKTRSLESFPQSFNHPSGTVGYTQLSNMREAFIRSQFIALYSSAHAQTCVPAATGKPLSAVSIGNPANSLQLTQRRCYIIVSHVEDTCIRHIDLTYYIYVYTYTVYIHVTIVSRNCFARYESLIHLWMYHTQRMRRRFIFCDELPSTTKTCKTRCGHRHKYLTISLTIVTAQLKSMDQSSSSEADSISPKEFPRLLRKPKFHNRVEKDSILGQTTAFHTIISSLLQIKVKVKLSLCLTN